MTDSIANVVGISIGITLAAFALGHMVGYWCGKGRVTCPLCEGRGSVPAKGPTINNEREVFDAGFKAGLREGLPGDGPRLTEPAEAADCSACGGTGNVPMKNEAGYAGYTRCFACRPAEAAEKYQNVFDPDPETTYLDKGKDEA